MQAYRKARESILFEYESAGLKIVQEESRFNEKFAARHVNQLESLKHACQLECRQLEAKFNSHDAAFKEELAQFRQKCDDVTQDLCTLLAETQKVVRRRTRWPKATPAPPPAPGLSRQRYFDSATAAFGRLATSCTGSSTYPWPGSWKMAGR